MLEKLFLIVIFKLTLIIPLNGQCRIYGKIVDVNTKKPLQRVSLQIKSKNIGTLSNEKGDFELNFTCNINDTLVITSIGFKPIIVKAVDVQNMHLFELYQNPIVLNTIRLKSKKSTLTLNKFSNGSTNYYLGNESTPEIAQSYVSPYKIYKLNKIILNKLAGSSTFRLKIYDYDSITGKPVSIIADSLITEILKKRKIEINLESLNLSFTSNKFFVGIEWVFSEDNRYTQKWNFQGKAMKSNVYKPEICLENKKGELNTTIWLKDETRSWFRSNQYNTKILLIAVEIEEEE